MMRLSGKLTGGAFSLLTRAFKNVVMTMAVIVAASGATMAQDQTIRPDFGFYQNDIYSLSYSIARKRMNELYTEPAPGNPLIGIAEEDLDGDGLPEIIAFPTEEYEQTGLYCTKKHDYLCPYYILQVRDQTVHTLGIIWADSVGLEAPVNGFWTIRAFTQERGGGKGSELYVYNRQEDKYERQGPGVPPLPVPQTPATTKTE